TGIAVGMATNIPPHNLSEVIDATIALAANPAMTVLQLMQHIPGPDFPTAGIIYGAGGLRSAYETGRGSIKVRGRVNIEQMKGNRERIIVTELPYQVNKATLLERIADMVREKKLEGISDLRDESNREGMRMVIELKRDATTDVVLNQLYQNTALQSSFGFNVVALVDGQPRILSLKEIIAQFLNHRREVVTRRSRFELREARKRFNVVYGLLAAIDSIDRIITIIRGAPDSPAAKAGLMAEKLPMSPAFVELSKRLVSVDYDTGKLALERGFMKLNDEQAQAILDMRLSRLTGLERDKLVEEAGQLHQQIEKLLAILASYELLMKVIVDELRAIKEMYTEPRRTMIEINGLEIADEDLIVDEDMVVTRSHSGYVKRVPPSTYRAQGRGGRGKAATQTRDEEDFIETVFVASMRSYVLAFTDKGRVYWMKVHELPSGAAAARGKPIQNLIRLQDSEKVRAILPVRQFTEGQNIVFVTKQGTVKKTDIMQFSNPRPSGIIALGIEEGDELVFVGLTDGSQQVVIATREGQAVRFDESQVRSMGRGAYGVRGIRFKKPGDSVVGAVIPQPGQVLLTVTDLGFGKRTNVDEYRQTNRGGSGVVNCKITARNGKVASLIGVAEDDHIMVVTDKGIMIRMVANSIRSTGRSSQGVRVIALGTGERVTSVTRLEDKDESLLTAPVALDEAELKAIEAEDAQALPEEPEDDAPPADDEPVGE
ncbi:MAG: DNA gyrase subunit A, partial [Clostridia bacterium]|nr:DNA gyrase subunit A [Deltaproteobacteria bacterium]